MVSPLDALAAELGAEVARIERELRREYELGMAQIRENLERLGRHAAEMTTRALTAEHELRELVRDRLAAIPDVASLVAAECDRREDAVASRAASLVPPIEVPDFGAMVTFEVDRQASDIALQVAQLVPPAEPPDVRQAVADELDRRENGLVSRIVALVPPADPPDVAGAVSAELDRVLQDVAVRAAGLIEPPDVEPVVAAAVSAVVEAAVPAAVSAELERREDAIVARAAAQVPAPDTALLALDVAASVIRDLDGRIPEIAKQAAELVPAPEVPDVNPVVAAAVEKAVGPAVEAQLPEIARQAFALVPPVEPPDVAAAVSAELVQRYDGIIDAAAALAVSRMPEPPDVPAAIDAALQQRLPEIEQNLPEIAKLAATLVPPPEPPNVAAALGEEFDRRQADMVAAAAALVRVPDAPELPDIGGMVDHAVAGAFACVRVPENGKSADPEDTARMVREEVTRAIAALPAGLSADEQRTLIGETVAFAVESAVDALPPAEKGDSVTVEQLQPAIETEIARQLAAAPPALDEAAVSNIVAMTFDAELERNLPEVAKQAAALVPTPEPPNVAAAVSAELDQRAEGIIEGTAVLVLQRLPEPPELPDIPAMVVESVAEAVARMAPAEKGDPGPPGSVDAEELSSRIEAAMSADLAVPDHVQRLIERASELLYEPFPMPEATAPAVTLNLAGVEQRGAVRKTIKTRRDPQGNLIAEVTEQAED